MHENGVLSYFRNGVELQGQERYRAGSWVRFGCDDGYDYTGDEQTNCHIGGHWSGTRNTPTCKSKEMNCLNLLLTQ